jgi:hypothetical protein
MLLILIGHWLGSAPSVKNRVQQAFKLKEFEENTFNLIQIGFITDGNNIADMDKVLKTIFLHRQPLDFVELHILAPAMHWPLIREVFSNWYKSENGLANSFNYSLYDSIECAWIADIFQSYFDTVYREAFCKLIFPYFLDPLRVSHLFLLDFDILVLNKRFTSVCWLETIGQLKRHPFAVLAIGHQGSPKSQQLPFPMPHLSEYNAHFHFNNGVVLFDVWRIHALDVLPEDETFMRARYPVASGPRRWLRDLQNVTLNYLIGHQAKHSLSQVLWNVYMADRPDSFVQLNQACNFQPCAQRTHVHTWDDANRHPNIIISHMWRACQKPDIADKDYFSSSYQALTYLPLHHPCNHQTQFGRGKMRFCCKCQRFDAFR